MQMSRLRKINIKNDGHYHPGEKINIKDLDLYKILVCETQQQNNFVQSFAYKALHSEKPFLFSFYAINGCIEKSGRDQHLSIIPKY